MLLEHRLPEDIEAASERGGSAGVFEGRPLQAGGRAYAKNTEMGNTYTCRKLPLFS